MRSVSTSEPNQAGTRSRRVEVAPQRLALWLDRYLARHPVTQIAWTDGRLLLASTGSSAQLTPIVALPEPAPGDDLCEALVRHASVSRTAALLLIRRGGYAVGIVRDGQVLAGKSGTRYVQSRTAAGGWSQQRYARRRAGQARDLVGAAAQAWHGLGPATGTGTGPKMEQAPIDLLVTGGDKALAAALLDAVRAGGSGTPLPAGLAVARHLVVPDPRRAVLVESAERVRSVQVTLTDLP